jgi:hypothetical protein
MKSKERRRWTTMKRWRRWKKKNNTMDETEEIE